MVQPDAKLKSVAQVSILQEQAQSPAVDPQEASDTPHVTKADRGNGTCLDGHQGLFQLLFRAVHKLARPLIRRSIADEIERREPRLPP